MKKSEKRSRKKRAARERRAGFAKIGKHSSFERFASVRDSLSGGLAIQQRLDGVGCRVLQHTGERAEGPFWEPVPNENAIQLLCTAIERTRVDAAQRLTVVRESLAAAKKDAAYDKQLAATLRAQAESNKESDALHAAMIDTLRMQHRAIRLATLLSELPLEAGDTKAALYSVVFDFLVMTESAKSGLHSLREEIDKRRTMMNVDLVLAT